MKIMDRRGILPGLIPTVGVKPTSAGNHAIAVQLAAYPGKIRGFGHVRQAQAGPVLAERDRLLDAFLGNEPAQLAEAAE